VEHSPWWLLVAFDSTIRPLLWDPEAIVRPYVAPGDRVADIGCGTGFFSAPLSRLVGPTGEVLLIDRQEVMLQRALDRCRRDPTATARLTPMLAAGQPLPLGEIDFALMSWMLHELEEPERLWGDLVPHLGPGAKVLVTEPKLHVSRRRFEAEIQPAEDLGLTRNDLTSIPFSYAAVLTAQRRIKARRIGQ